MSYKRIEAARRKGRLAAKQALADGDVPEPHASRKKRKRHAVEKLLERRRARRRERMSLIGYAEAAIVIILLWVMADAYWLIRFASQP